MTIEHLTVAARASTEILVADMEPTSTSKLQHVRPTSRDISRRNSENFTNIQEIITKTHLQQQQEPSSSAVQNRKGNLTKNKNKKSKNNNKTKITESNNHKNPFYFVLLNLILICIRIFAFIRENLHVLYYLFYSFKKRNEQEDQDFGANKNEIQMPKHVCVLLNDQNGAYSTSKLNDDKLFNLYDRIIDYLIRYDNNKQIEMLTFFKFDGISTEVKERICAKLNTSPINYENDRTNSKDLNNNNSNNLIRNRAQTSLNESNVHSSNKATFQLNFLNYETGGKSLFIDSCKSIAKQTKKNELSPNQVNIDLIDKIITGKLIYPAPVFFFTK
jgi:undecaprenyl pyrophosphate synthase